MPATPAAKQPATEAAETRLDAVVRNLSVPWMVVANLFILVAVFMLPGWTASVPSVTAVVLITLNIVHAYHLARSAGKSGA